MLKVIASQLNSHSNNDLLAATAESRNEFLFSNKSFLKTLSESNKMFQDLSFLESELKLKNVKLRSKLDILKLRVSNLDKNSCSVKTSSLITHKLQETFE